MKAELAKAGISDYSIYLDPKTLRLFGIQHVADDATDDLLPTKAIVRNGGILWSI